MLTDDYNPRMKRSFDDLVQLMTRLRGPDGCPWDRKQTLPDLKPYVIEEAYEVVDAIDRNDRAALLEEIGDFLLEAVFITEITREEGTFDVYDSITATFTVTRGGALQLQAASSQSRHLQRRPP